jgi:hypothetical protein
MGRTSLIMVMGFNIAFMIQGFNLSQISMSAYQKYTEYGGIEQAGLAMESAANIAVSNSRTNPGAAIDSTVFVSFKNGTFNISKTSMDNRFLLRAIGNYNGMICTTVVISGKPSFSQYAMYSVSEKIGTDPIYWITGDTCKGPLHTQDYLYVSGNPVFTGMVTTLKGVNKMRTSDDPKFNGGYNKGLDIGLPSDFTDVVNLGGAGGAVYNNVKTYIEFLANGKVIVRTGTNGWGETRTTLNTTPNPDVYWCKTYSSVSELTTNGVLLVQTSELHVKGVLDGQITLGCVGTGSKVFLDSSITYKEPPKIWDGDNNMYVKNPDCDDMLGIVADNDIHISVNAEYNGPSTPRGMTIHASMISKLGGFGAESYDSRVIGGMLKVVGGIQQKARDPVGTFSGGSINHGFQKNYDYDERLLLDAPKGYPPVQTYVVQNWYDQSTIPEDFWE